MRPALAVGAAAVVLLVAYVALALTGIAGGRGGWLWAAIVLAIPSGAAAAATVGPRPTRVRVVVPIVAFAVLLGLWTATQAHFTHGRLWAVMGDINLPPGLSEVAENENGNPLCLDVCPAVTRLFVAEADIDRWTNALGAALRREGFELTPWREDYTPAASGQLRAASGSRGRLEIRVEVGTAPLQTYADDGSTPTTIPVPAGKVGVSISLTT